MERMKRMRKLAVLGAKLLQIRPWREAGSGDLLQSPPLQNPGVVTGRHLRIEVRRTRNDIENNPVDKLQAIGRYEIFDSTKHA
jgi:hypothetical protein